MKINDIVCEICGAFATNAVRDVKETNPSPSPWRTLEPDGEPHYFCARHSRKSRTKRLDGSIERDGELATLVATRAIQRLK